MVNAVHLVALSYIVKALKPAMVAGLQMALDKIGIGHCVKAVITGADSIAVAGLLLVFQVVLILIGNLMVTTSLL